MEKLGLLRGLETIHWLSVIVLIAFLVSRFNQYEPFIFGTFTYFNRTFSRGRSSGSSFTPWLLSQGHRIGFFLESPLSGLCGAENWCINLHRCMKSTDLSFALPRTKSPSPTKEHGMHSTPHTARHHISLKVLSGIDPALIMAHTVLWHPRQPSMDVSVGRLPLLSQKSLCENTNL